VISTILNITRIHNAIYEVQVMRRGIAVARDYASRRQVFGKLLQDQPLHLTTLADLEVQYRGALQMLLDLFVLLGKSECKVATSEEETMLRLLTPLLKLYTAKQSISVASEVIECLGGTGYMEDSDIPRLLRDAQVGSIWEGTTNVLSMDVWRALRSANAFEIFMSYISKKLVHLHNKALQSSISKVSQAIDDIKKFVEKSSKDQECLEATAREFAFSLSRMYIGSLLLEHAEWSSSTADVEVARRWCEDHPLVDIHYADANRRDLTRELALDVDPVTKQPRGTGNTMPDGTPRARY